MTYIEHLKFSIKIFLNLLPVIPVSLIHAFLPFLFVEYSSRKIAKINQIINNKKCACKKCTCKQCACKK